MRARVGEDLRQVGVRIVEGYVCRVGGHEVANYFRVEGVLE